MLFIIFLPFITIFDNKMAGVSFLHQNTMNNIFYYENGQGEIFDEQGNEEMDWEEEVDLFYLKNLINFGQYQELQSPELDPS